MSMSLFAFSLLMIGLALRRRSAERRSAQARTTERSRRPLVNMRKEDAMDATMLFGLVRGYLDDEEFAYRVLDDTTAVEGVVRGQHAMFSIRVRVLPDPLLVQTSVLLPNIVPEDRRGAVAEVVVRANAGLPLGRFDYDAASGLVTFRTAIPVLDGTLSAAQFRTLVVTALATADQYQRAFCRLLYGDDLSPAEAVAEVEMAD